MVGGSGRLRGNLRRSHRRLGDGGLHRLWLRDCGGLGHD